MEILTQGEPNYVNNFKRRGQDAFLRLFRFEQPQPKAPHKRQRVFVKIVLAQRRFIILDDITRTMVFRKKGRHSAFNNWSDEKRHLYLLNLAIKWVRFNMPGVSISMTAPIEQRKETKWAA